jgi:hypothetical protein
LSYEIEGAVVKEQGITFAIVVVKDDIIPNAAKSKKAVSVYSKIFPDMPIILLGRDSQGKSTYYGQENIASFLAGLDPNVIPWRRYIITD